MDLSQTGLLFLKDRDKSLEKLIRGILTFSNGETKRIEGEIIWEREKEIGLKITS